MPFSLPPFSIYCSSVKSEPKENDTTRSNMAIEFFISVSSQSAHALCYNGFSADTAQKGHRFPMRLRLVFVTLLLTSLITRLPINLLFAQTLEDVPPPVVESPPPSSEGSPTIILPEKHQSPEYIPYEHVDDVIVLGDLRRAVLISPDSQEARLALAQGLYRIGDLDAAIDECRVAITLNPNNAKAHVQLGITLMAKQDSRTAAMALKEAIRLDPDLTQIGRAHV